MMKRKLGAMSAVQLILWLVSFRVATAQEIGPEFQVTSSLANDRNPIARYYEDMTWLFWEREMPDGWRIFYRQLTPDGQLIGDETQLTFGPQSDSTMKLAGGYSSPPEFLLVTWERIEQGNSDVVFQYLTQDQWSDLYEAFATDGQEREPCGMIGRDDEFTYLFVAACRDCSIVYKRYVLDNGEPLLLESDEIRRLHTVSSLSCCYYEYDNPFTGDHEIYMAFCWQETAADDTTIFWRQYFTETGWSNFILLELDSLQAFNPSFEKAWNLHNEVYFSHVANDTERVGKAEVWSGGTGQIINDIFGPFPGNERDPYIFDLWKTFASDCYGNEDVFFYFPLGFLDPWYLLSTSAASDINPSCCQSDYYWTDIFWQSDRNGNWDIYGRTGYNFFLGIEDPSRSPLLPDQIRISVSPNPGNAEFQIDLELPVSGEVEAAIYDLSGRRVARIQDGWMGMGSHDLTWNAQGLPSGIYMVQAESGKYHQTRKVVLLK